jgi:hypothetical protein
MNAVREANTIPAPDEVGRERDRTGEPHGELRFTTSQERRSAEAALAESGLLVVTVEALSATARGALGEVIDDAIERELGVRAAGSPSLIGAASFSSYRDATLSDQLFRARRAGARGIALFLASLRPLTDPFGRALDPHDTATLSFLGEATRDRCLILHLDAADASLPAHFKPTPLSEVLGPPPIAPTLVPPAFVHPSAPAPASASVPVHVSVPARAPASAPAPAPAPASAPALTPTLTPAPIPRVDAARPHTQHLTSARGPQPLATLEKLFTDHYVPLHHLLAAGLDDARARDAYDQFSASFSRSYSDAFSTFAVTGKRPRMVFDAHDVAARIARLHGARNVRLLLVDAMRWDVARSIQTLLPARLSGATLTDELVLWSALPTTTSRQLETVARGLEALRAPASLEAEPEPPRGRNAEHVRRMRVGPREIHKLDLVESRIRGARSNVLAELPAIAEEAAEVIARHAHSLTPRTLLFVFGDHGFTVDRKGFAAQGGASPEEVLVGAFALLVGDVH